MWLIKNTNKATRWWIASPSSGGSNYPIFVDYRGYFSYVDAYDTSCGFRPVVVIPKASL